MRVAVASTDGRTINRDFSRATEFQIYEVTPAGHFLTETRRSRPSRVVGDREGSPGGTRAGQAIDLIDDCGAVLCTRIEDAVAELLRQHGIKPLEAPLPVDQALDTFSRFMARRRM